MPDTIGVLYCLNFFVKQAVNMLYLEKYYEDLVMKHLQLGTGICSELEIIRF